MKVFNENEPVRNPKLRGTMRTLKQSAGALEEQVFLEALKQASCSPRWRWNRFRPKDRDQRRKHAGNG